MSSQTSIPAQDIARQNLIDDATRKLLDTVNTDLYKLFSPEYTESGDEKIQTNPFVVLHPGERADVLIEACLILVAQITAETLVTFKDTDQMKVMSKILNRLNRLTEAFHKQRLAEKEADEQLAKDMGKGTPS